MSSQRTNPLPFEIPSKASPPPQPPVNLDFSSDFSDNPRGLLLEMLKYKRPAGSRTEIGFITRFIDSIGCQKDEFGNRFMVIGRDPDILWSSHTDTVHFTGGLQHVIEGVDGVLSVNHGDCLGADCTTGVWLMIGMIKAKVPGLYVFHREEEIGGNGSLSFANNHKSLLEPINYAIAFDRKGYSNIITSQIGSECASNAFAESLSKALGGNYKAATGTFTDTANYTHIIPECTNISVGYFNQHTSSEEQDLEYALELYDFMTTRFDPSLLVCERIPAPSFKPSHFGRSFVQDAYDYQDSVGKSFGSSPNPNLVEMIKRNPETAAKIFEEFGLTLEDFEESVWNQDHGY